jgi:hypothetical protein
MAQRSYQISLKSEVEKEHKCNMGISYIYISFYLRKKSMLKMVHKPVFHCHFI